jgi:hypothetical protein
MCTRGSVILWQGKETFPSGDVYQGEWLNDLKEGQGVLKYADGHIYDGTWKKVCWCCWW